jgi:hypothetical protein
MVAKWLILIFTLFSLACATTTSPTLALLGQLTFAQSASIVEQSWVIEGDSHAYLLKPMVAYAESRGIPVYFINKLEVDGEPVAGGYSRKNRKIYLGATLAPNMQVATLAHELGHSFAFKALVPNTPVSEVYAEVISCMVTEAFGLDTKKQAFAYIIHAQYEGIYAMQLYSKEIEAAVKEIVEGIRSFQ